MLWRAALQQPIPPDLGKNARALVEKQYTLAAVVSRYEALYARLATRE
jgi:hypothetical protein